MNGMALAMLILGGHSTAEASESMAATQTKSINSVHLVDEKPLSVVEVEPGVYLVDFGKVAFGNIMLLKAHMDSTVSVRFGEAMENGRINRKPPGTVRYAVAQVELKRGTSQVVAPAADARNTEVNSLSHPPAILTPNVWGVIVPFRWVEIEGWQGKFSAANIKRRSAFDSTWDDRASSFESSDPTLNRIWDLCKYSIKATTFAGVFVDGDRERIPYEADAFLNQLYYYATSTKNRIPRATYDHLMANGTWPTEWAYHMVFMAHADWMRTGDTAWLSQRYDALKAKLLMHRVGENGLVQSMKSDIERTDIVDWPTGERDGYQFRPLNTVVNAFYVRSLRLMSEMGKALGRDAEAANYAELEARARVEFQETFFDSQTGLYRDGSGTEHQSLHANLFPLAFNLTLPTHRESIAKWLKKRGMKCSVYAAQYLMEGLFENGEAAGALELMMAPGDRSWRHMVESGTTITWEAWDQKYKPNQDWNHAWGAAPANLLPKYILGVQAQAPGWKSILVKPHTGSLTFAKGKVPSPLGPVLVDWSAKKSFTLTLKLPRGMSAMVEVPAGSQSKAVLVNGKPVAARREESWWILESEVQGSVKVEVK